MTEAAAALGGPGIPARDVNDIVGIKGVVNVPIVGLWLGPRPGFRDRLGAGIPARSTMSVSGLYRASPLRASVAT